MTTYFFDTSAIPAPIFVCADHDLLTIANAEGLGTENPNQYS